MKNSFLTTLFVCIVILSTCYSVFSNKKPVPDLLLSNLEALANSESGTSTGSVTCYSTYNSCWFWNCEHIWRCSGNECYDVKCDSKSDMGTCTTI